MRKVKLFEAFTKKHGEKISKDEFKNIPIGHIVKYMGADFAVDDADDTILILKNVESGKKIHVNYNMFNKQGIIFPKK